MIFWQRATTTQCLHKPSDKWGQFGPSLSTFGVRRRPRRDRSARGPFCEKEADASSYWFWGRWRLPSCHSRS